MCVPRDRARPASCLDCVSHLASTSVKNMTARTVCALRGIVSPPFHSTKRRENLGLYLHVLLVNGDRYFSYSEWIVLPMTSLRNNAHCKKGKGIEIKHNPKHISCPTFLNVLTLNALSIHIHSDYRHIHAFHIWLLCQQKT